MREILASGRALVGVARCDITPAGREPMAGFSFSGQEGSPGPDRLFARVLSLRDAETDEQATLVVLDLMSASLALHQAAVRSLEELGHPALAASLVLLGTHTHAAPGRFYGCSFYDTFAQPFTLGGYQEELVAGWAAQIAEAALEARARARLATVVIARGELFGVGRNRSYAAHAKNFDARTGAPRHERAPVALTNEQAAIDPRLTVLTAHESGSPLAVFSWYGCHPTTLGRHQSTYARDWPGVSVDLVERELGAFAGIGQGTLGDVSPHVRAGDGVMQQSPELARAVGTEVGRAIVALARQSCEVDNAAPLPLTLTSGVFSVERSGSEPRWQIGVPALGGSEDGGPSFGSARGIAAFFAEGFVGAGGVQAPKAPALGPVQTLLDGPLDLSPYHPWHRLQIGSHVFVTVPGEPTVMAGRELEARVREELEVGSVTVVACAGDYAGYFTTPAEYDAQHYEGASTLYGRHSLAWYADALLGPEARVPARGQPILPDLPRLPRRSLDELLTHAFELESPGRGTRLVFALDEAPGDAPPTAMLVTASGEHNLVVRREPHPDRVGAPHLQVYSARGAPSAVLAAGSATLSIASGGAVADRHVVALAESRARFAPPPSFGRRQAQGSVAVPALALAAFCLALFSVTFVVPHLVLEVLAQAASPLRCLLLRMTSLSFLLLGVELLASKNSEDSASLRGLAHAALLWMTTVLALALFLGGGALAIVLSGLGLVLGLAFDFAVTRAFAGRPVPTRESSALSGPLGGVALLTAVVGTFLVSFGDLVASWLGASADPVASLCVRAYGLGFWVNTLSMRAAAKSRDPAVLRGQLKASLLFDGATVVLLAVAVGLGHASGLALLFSVPYLVITVWFPRLLARAPRFRRAHVTEPRTVREIREAVRGAHDCLGIVRVVGSGHSVDPCIYADHEPMNRSRPSDRRDVHLNLSRLARLVAVDRVRSRVTVEAGMHLGESPDFPDSAENSLLLHLDHLALALGDLGGIVHQSVAGFLSTGSSGGSLAHSVAAAVVELRFIDGQGRLRVVRRDDADPSWFDASLVSVGLMGIFVEATFECEPEYMVGGTEFVAPVDPAGVLHLPESSVQPGQLDLRAPGALAAYLRRVEYGRILWWPQRGVEKMAVFEARRAASGGELRPYRGDSGFMQRVAGTILRLVGFGYGSGVSRVLGELVMKFFPRIIVAFLPDPPKQFYAKWHQNLPMDTSVDDFVLPVEFTELWFPLERTHEVMSELLEMYRDPRLTGAFACELYAAKAASAWLSPGFRRDSFRVDLFWFKNNQGDPVRDYYPEFWRRLAPFAFRPHLGKHLPPAGCAEGAAYLEAGLPRLGDFRALRQASDPRGVFVSRYWREHLRL